MSLPATTQIKSQARRAARARLARSRWQLLDIMLEVDPLPTFPGCELLDRMRSKSSSEVESTVSRGARSSIKLKKHYNHPVWTASRDCGIIARNADWQWLAAPRSLDQSKQTSKYSNKGRGSGGAHRPTHFGNTSATVQCVRCNETEARLQQSVLTRQKSETADVDSSSNHFAG